MLDICTNCGAYRPDKMIDPNGPLAVCPECTHAEPFQWLPLFVVGGASGAGKTTVCRQVVRAELGVVALDMDILWRAELDTPSDGYRVFFDTWLRLAANISQAGRPVVLFGAGAGEPGNIEPCLHRRYFSAVHYLALVCDAETLAMRLRARPAWRGSGTAAFVAGQQQFNQWFKDHAHGPPPIRLVDTAEADEISVAAEVMTWISGAG